LKEDRRLPFLDLEPVAAERVEDIVSVPSWLIVTDTPVCGSVDGR